MSEKLERVKDFGELRDGAIVVLKACDFCGAAHRAMLIGLRFAIAARPNGEIEQGNGWPMHPKPKCCKRLGDALINARTVSSGRVFRVVDGLESPQTTERAKERVR